MARMVAPGTGICKQRVITRFAREYSGHERQEILRELRRASGVTVTTRALGDSGNWTAATPTVHPAEQTPPPDSPASDKNDEGPPTPPVVGP